MVILVTYLSRNCHRLPLTDRISDVSGWVAVIAMAKSQKCDVVVVDLLTLTERIKGVILAE